MLGQRQPDEKAASGVGPAYPSRHVLPQRGERAVSAHVVKRPEALDMRLPRAAATIRCNHLGHKRVCAAAHLRRATVNTALNNLLRAEQPSQAQAGRKRFGETAHAHNLATLPQSIETGRDSTLKR